MASQKFAVKPLHLFLGFVVLSFIIAFLVGGFVLGQNTANKQPPLGSPKPTAKAATPTPIEQTDKKIFCTQDAMECPDGSYVGRTGPNCEFAKCPGK